MEHLGIYVWLVVYGLEYDWIMTFHDIGNVIIPTDFHIFQRGWNHQPDMFIYLIYSIHIYSYIIDMYLFLVSSLLTICPYTFSPGIFFFFSHEEAPPEDMRRPRTKRPRWRLSWSSTQILATRLEFSWNPHRPHEPCIQMYAASSYFPRHMGGGGVITFLGLDVGRTNHQGRNFHFLSTFWESYSTSPVRLCTAFAPLSLCFLELWRHSCCMLKLGPMVDMSVPTSGLHPRFSLLRQQTSNSWSVHWNMLHIGIYWMKHKGN